MTDPSAPATSSQPPPAPTFQEIEAGGWRITTLFDAYFRLDGGAMWGVVPKNLWARMTPPAEDNSILMAARPYLAERDGVRVLVEGGMGDRWTEKMRGIYHLDRRPESSLEGSLAALDLGPLDIDHVVCSHCHFDHIGALVAQEGEALVPRFPRARHHFPEAELRAARTPHHPRRASYRADDIEPLIDAGLVDWTSGDTELLDGIGLRQVGGHSEGMTIVLFGEAEDGPTAAFWGDLIPTSHHIQPPYIMAYDVDVPRSFEMRTHWLARAADEGLIGMSYHDPERPFTRLVKDGRRYAAIDVAEVRARKR
ncbi:MAG: MBL fold metallo-hydrolase [Planctomycetota bacterium]